MGTKGNWTQVSAGLEHACATYGDGLLWCWGSNLDGELGIDNVSITQADTPQQVAGTGWAQVTAGGDHTCAIRTDHTLWCWGANGSGQLGVGSRANKAKPVQVGTQAVWAQVSTGNETTCAVWIDGTLWCWGLNLYGQLGNGTFTSQLVPVRVGASTWRQVSVGSLHTCAVRADRTLWCWGGNCNGQLGNNLGPNREPSPVRVGTSSTWVQVTAGGHHTCALHGDPTLWCWGDNGSGELGIGTAGGNVHQPTRVGTQTYWAQASADEGHTCAIRRDLTLRCWGENGSGELGIGATPTQEIRRSRSAEQAAQRQVRTGGGGADGWNAAGCRCEFRLTAAMRLAKPVGMASRISHTTFDARDSYAQSLFWSQVLDFVEDPDDPNKPEHQECLITSRDGSQLLLFVAVPDGKQLKNRVHLDLRPADRTREEEVERLLALGATQFADHRRPDGSGWITLLDPEGNEFCILSRYPARSGATT